MQSSHQQGASPPCPPRPRDIRATTWHRLWGQRRQKTASAKWSQDSKNAAPGKAGRELTGTDWHGEGCCRALRGGHAEGRSQGCPLTTGQAAGCRQLVQLLGVQLLQEPRTGWLSACYHAPPPARLSTSTAQGSGHRPGHRGLPSQGAYAVAFAPWLQALAGELLSPEPRFWTGPRGLPEARPAPLLPVSAPIQGDLSVPTCPRSGSPGSIWLILCPCAWLPVHSRCSGNKLGYFPGCVGAPRSLRQLLRAETAWCPQNPT